MTEDNYRKFDLLLKTLGFTLTILSLIFGFIKLSIEIESRDRLEFRRNLWNNQREIYHKVCKSAGSIVISLGDSTLFEKRKQEFYSLYWGEMILVEDSLVEQAMIEFHLAVHDYNTYDEELTKQIKYKAAMLVKACKNSSDESWDLIN